MQGLPGDVAGWRAISRVASPEVRPAHEQGGWVILSLSCISLEQVIPGYGVMSSAKALYLSNTCVVSYKAGVEVERARQRHVR